MLLLQKLITEKSMLKKLVEHKASALGSASTSTKQSTRTLHEGEFQTSQRALAGASLEVRFFVSLRPCIDRSADERLYNIRV